MRVLKICWVSEIQSHSLLPHTHAQGVKQLVCPSVVVVVGTKIAICEVLHICACCNHNKLVEIGEKLVSTCFKWLIIAY